MELSMTGAAVVFFSAIAFWKFDRTVSAIPFLLAGASALLLGYTWFDHYGTQASLGVSLILFAYWVTCYALSFRALFIQVREVQ